jgi:hypothetical protein
MQLLHNPDADPSTPNTKAIERAEINAQVFEWLAAGNTITTLPSCKPSPLIFRWCAKEQRLVDGRKPAVAS